MQTLVPSDSRETAHDVSITLPSRVLPLKLVHSALAAAIVAQARRRFAASGYTSLKISPLRSRSSGNVQPKVCSHFSIDDFQRSVCASKLIITGTLSKIFSRISVFWRSSSSACFRFVMSSIMPLR